MKSLHYWESHHSCNKHNMVTHCILFYLQVFALGNKTYEHYNAMGKYVDKRLEDLGAKRIFDLGLGDDDGK